MRIPDIVALNLEKNPGGQFYIYDPATEGIVTITHLEFGRASHRAANLFLERRKHTEHRVIAVLALSDALLYHAVVVGLMTADFIVRALRPRCGKAH
ncbi:hypothetical protein K438DRAFT_1588953 [Mycena galopus ATCC 62051]|nr:hypothetical protein K438DRAFT_1588953 [Mycena galopus ATCC 62051]